MRAFEHVVIPKMKTPVIYMNISRLTDYRKDGHPSIYRMEYKTAEEQTAAEQHQDCSHWCFAQLFQWPLPYFKRETYSNSFQVSGTPGKHQ